MNLAQQIRDAHAYLELFDYDNYPGCFEAFSRSCEPFFAQLREEALSAEVEALMDELEQSWKTLPRRAARDAALQDKRVLALLLTPVALAQGGPVAAFAQLLQERWNARFPRNLYYPGTYDKIMAGFDANLLGLPLRKSKKRYAADR